MLMLWRMNRQYIFYTLKADLSIWIIKLLFTQQKALWCVFQFNSYTTFPTHVFFIWEQGGSFIHVQRFQNFIQKLNHTLSGM